MDLALNNLLRLICQTNKPSQQNSLIKKSLYWIMYKKVPDPKEGDRPRKAPKVYNPVNS